MSTANDLGLWGDAHTAVERLEAERDEWRDLARRLARIVGLEREMRDTYGGFAGIPGAAFHRLAGELEEAHAAVSDAALARVAAPDDGEEGAR